jgi:hypothetical protein
LSCRTLQNVAFRCRGMGWFGGARHAVVPPASVVRQVYFKLGVKPPKDHAARMQPRAGGLWYHDSEGERCPFSTGLSSGLFDGRCTRVRFAGTLSVFAVCQPARSRINAAWTSWGSSLENSSRNAFITCVLAWAVINPQASPVSGQTALNTYQIIILSLSNRPRTAADA